MFVTRYVLCKERVDPRRVKLEVMNFHKIVK